MPSERSTLVTDLGELLRLQLELQRRIPDSDPTAMTVAQRVDYVKDMILSCTDELHEALNETTWKRWTKTEPNVHQEHYFKELIDAFHFMLNLFLAAYPDAPPEMLALMIENSYKHKRVVNIARQDNSYDGIATKCPSCKRALEDISLTVIHDDAGKPELVFCGVCGTPLEMSVVAPFLVD